MQKKLIYIFLALVAAVLIIIVVVDILGDRPDKRGDNPFDLNVDQYRDVDPELIKYDETKNFKLQDVKYRGIYINGNEVNLVADNFLQVIDKGGRELRRFDLPDSPRAVFANEEDIYIAFEKSVSRYSIGGELIKAFSPLNDSTLLTSITFVGESVFVADAGNRKVYRYSPGGELLGDFEGKREVDDLHGFIIPSPYFDVLNNDDELWVVNPGLHAIENYSFDGSMRGFWERNAVTVDGFGGCCNPSHISALPDGRFVTSEKGIVRIKVYEQSGKFAGVVAEPKKFYQDGPAPDIAVSEEGHIYALDYYKNIIRVFEEK